MVREPANRGTGESADDVSNPILMKMLKVSRGSLFICDTCYHIIEESGQIEGDRATSDAVIGELCPNCEDQNKPLLDDLLGSEE